MHLCEIFGASLATVENDQKDLYIKGLLGRLGASLPTREVWLGGTEMLNEGEWMWAKTFQKITYFRWAPNEPNNGAAASNQHCLGMEKDQDFKWDDNTCTKLAVPLCERPIDLPWGKEATNAEQIIG
ncbi:perlucin-like [Mytilus edulis]|uniref:perlucin-like n=1 Tax=Mytilus edulis TaxID=6550 RepID=UPI0039EE3D95